MTEAHPTFPVDVGQPIVVRDFQNAEKCYTFMLDSAAPPKLLEKLNPAEKVVIAGFCKAMNPAVEREAMVCFFSLEQFRHEEISGPSWQTSRWFRASDGLTIDCTRPDIQIQVSRGLFRNTFGINAAGKEVFRHKYRSTVWRDVLLSDGSDPWGSDFFRFVAWHQQRAQVAASSKWN